MPDGTLLALGSALAFGAALVVTQRGLAHLRPLAGARISILTTAALFWLPAPWAFDAQVLGSPALGIFAAVGLFFPLLVTLLTFEANRVMGPTIAGSLGSVAPLLSLGAGVLVLHEALTPRLAGAALLVALGVAALSFRREAGARRWPKAMLALPLAAAALRAAAQALTKIGLGLVPSPYTAALAGYTVSALAVWLVALPGGRMADGPATPGARGRWRQGAPWFMAAGLLNGSAVLAMYGALSRAPLTVVAPIVAAYPIGTIVFSLGLLRSEPPGARHIAAALAIVAGMVLVLA